jgi:hypothetical protein
MATATDTITPQHERNNWVQIDEKDLARHCLSGEFFISPDALSQLSGDGLTLFDLLDWFNMPRDPVTVGETREITPTLQAHFGFDGNKPNGCCFFVAIDAVGAEVANG